MSIGKSNEPQAAKSTHSWQDDVHAASPKRALYHTALRTGGYVNNNLAENYVEFWAILRTDPQQDKWRIMHYKLFDMNLEEGKFVSARILDKDVDFIEAIAHLSRNEYVANKQMMHSITDMDSKYPGTQYPELRVHYYDIPHYKDAAHVEGIAFDQYNNPYRRLEGKIFADATFRRRDVVKSILAVENTENINAGPVEAGILSDIFSTSSARAATLDRIIRMGECLNVMDDFAVSIAAFYMSVQKMLGQVATLDAIESMTANERKTVLRKAAHLAVGSYDRIVEYVLPTATEQLEKAEGTLGIHTEPFSKFLAECEVYLHLLNASIRLPKLEQSLHSINNADMDQVIQIQQSMQKAEQTFKRLGGTEEHVDQLKAWVANPSKEDIPAWLPNFLNRYYVARSKALAKSQARDAQLRDIKLMSTQVKPPVQDQQPVAETEQKSAAEQDNSSTPAQAAAKTQPAPKHS